MRYLSGLANNQVTAHEPLAGIRRDQLTQLINRAGVTNIVPT